MEGEEGGGGEERGSEQVPLLQGRTGANWSTEESNREHG